MDGQVSLPPPQHGHKRHADDNLENEQRLAKRFNLLNLGTKHNGHLYIPIDTAWSARPTAPNGRDESMQLDDSKDKVYIHNLDAELLDVESDEEKLIFLPDIEKKLAKIPKSVLTSQYLPSTNNQMVLYNVPSSLSVPQEQDNVRRAIIDSRARAREKQAHEQKMTQLNGLAQGDQSHEKNDGLTNLDGMEADEDAMDLG
ncbi:MAG: hypothetical protein Q9190_006221 [Brigantiaea leucoxantha]